MRNTLLHAGYKELSYEIREIVAFARQIEATGIDISWENIGDPVEKGEKIPVWMKKIITDALQKDEVYGYSPSKGLESAREYLASKRDNLSKDNIIFFNGLGEAINKTYGYLSFASRVIGPSPAYPSHASAEATNSGTSHLTYSLDPNNDWNPDLEEIENKVRYNPNVVAILVINPDNPTGAVFKKEVLEGIVDIARRYDLFVIFDEIYEKLVYDESEKVLLGDIVGDVPGISMKGMSKDLPWPGGRCGWIEIYNADKDKVFAKYVNSIFLSKMLEVCSTTLPQYVLPTIYEHPEFKKYNKKRVQKYQDRADKAQEVLGNVSGLRFIKPKGAFYLSVILDTEVLDTDFTPSIASDEIQSILAQTTKGVSFDKKFCYYLIASSGICTVPLSGFNTPIQGFRITLLEENLEKFTKNLETIRDFVEQYKK